MEELMYPIGRFERREVYSTVELAAALVRMESLPGRLRAAVEPLEPAQLDTRYRPGGWTVRQVVHHLPDSHLNSYVRVKLALTEENPTIRPYDEAAWAELEDARRGPIEPSLELLEAVHARWIPVLRSLGAAELARTFFHPEAEETFDLATQIALYDWHGEHHLAHVARLAEREGW